MVVIKEGRIRIISFDENNIDESKLEDDLSDFIDTENCGKLVVRMNGNKLEVIEEVINDGI